MREALSLIFAVLAATVLPVASPTRADPVSSSSIPGTAHEFMQPDPGGFGTTR
jgi:hypothetical protein